MKDFCRNWGMNSELLRGDKSNARARKASKDRFQVVLLDSLLKTGRSQQWDELPCLVMSVLLLETSKQSLYLLFKSFRGDSLPAHLEYLGPCDAVHNGVPHHPPPSSWCSSGSSAWGSYCSWCHFGKEYFAKPESSSCRTQAVNRHLELTLSPCTASKGLWSRRVFSLISQLRENVKIFFKNCTDLAIFSTVKMIRVSKMCAIF